MVHVHQARPWLKSSAENWSEGYEPRVVDRLRLAHTGSENARIHYAEEHLLGRVQS